MKHFGKAWMLIALILALSLSLFSCQTLAIWQRQGSDTQEIDVTTREVNGSEKYIVYAALDGSGDLIAADDDVTDAAAYAVVGYTGLVAELVIPASYTDTNIYTAPSGTDHSLHVTKVLVVGAYTAYKCSRNGAAYPVENGTSDDARLANNPVVKSIVFGSNVTEVGAGVCAGMVNLQEIKFTSSSAVVLGHAAFSACNSLSTVTGNWTPASGATPFLASGYTPS